MSPGVGDVLLAAASLLLVIAGAPKVGDPLPVVRALRSVGWPGGRWAVRALAIVEVGAGAGCLITPRPLAVALVGLLYAGFTAFVVTARARGGVVASCGCFGKADTPPTLGHAAITLLLGAGALLALAGKPPIPLWRNGFAVESWSAILGAALIALLAWIVMGVLPTVSAAAIRSVNSRPAERV